jgi:threonine/homoserine/homoserine lactone efflux protein
MSLDLWLAYLLAAAIILVIPGPTIILVISQAVSHGKKSVVPLVTGVVLGDFTAMVLSLLGLGALLSISALLFTVLKWIGACYLVYLGIRLWRTKPQASKTQQPARKSSNGSLFKSSYIVTSLNPKGIVFFIAFLPQFINPGAPVPSQLAILGASFLILAGINATLYALFAGQLREYMQNWKVRRCFDRCGGTALIGAGIVTAAIK